MNNTTYHMNFNTLQVATEQEWIAEAIKRANGVEIEEAQEAIFDDTIVVEFIDGDWQEV